MAMLKTNIIVVVSLRLNLNFKRVFPPIFLFQEESLLETQDQWQAFQSKPESQEEKNHSEVL